MKTTNECIKGAKSWENTVILDDYNLDRQEIAELCSDVTILAPVLETFQLPNSTEPHVSVTIGDQICDFLVDNGASKSILQSFPENFRAVGTMAVVGATGIDRR